MTRRKKGPSEKARQLITAYMIATNNVAIGRELLAVREAREAELPAYITDLEQRLGEAVGEWDNLVEDRRALMQEQRSRKA